MKSFEESESLDRRYSLDLFQQNTTAYDSTWYADSLFLRQMHGIQPMDTSIIIAIIDTGVFFDHLSLQNAWVLNSNEMANGEDSDFNGFEDDVLGFDFVHNKGIYELSHDDNGHGTAMASILVGKSVLPISGIGIAPNAKILSVKSFDRYGTANSLEIARGIVYAAERGADIINLSFGDSFKSALVESAVIYAYHKGAILVGSAGNIGGNTIRYPSGFPQVQAVSWLNTQWRIASTANYGTHIQFAAPGSSIPHASLNSISSYVESNGSSASAAIVSGLFAWLKSMKPTLNNSEITSMVIENSKDLELTGVDSYTGYGLPVPYFAFSDEQLNAQIQLELENYQNDEFKLLITVLGENIKSWKLDWIFGQDIQSKSNSLITSQTQLISDSIRIRIPIESIKGKTISFILNAQLWNGKELIRAIPVFIPESPIHQQLIFSDWMLTGNHLSLGLLNQSNQSVQHRISIVSNEIKIRNAQADRTGYNHLIALDPINQGTYQLELESTNNGQTFRLDTSLFVSKPPEIHHSEYVEEKKELALTDSWTLHVDYQDSTATWFVYQFQNVDGTYYSEITDRTFLGNDSTFSVTFPYRFIPQNCYRSESKQLFLLVGYGGGKAFVFDIQKGFEIVPMDGLNSFPYLGLITDSDGDGNPELWAHNRSEVGIFEWNGIDFIQKQRIKNPTKAETSLFPNEIQIPNFIRLKNYLGTEDIFLGDYDGDLLQIRPTGNDSWEIYKTYEGNFFGVGNELEIIENSKGEQFLATVRHAYPGLDAKNSKQPEWARLELYRFNQDSLELKQSLLFSDIDFELISIKSAAKDTFFVAISPYFYKIILNQSSLESLQIQRVGTNESLQFIEVQKDAIYWGNYFDSEISILQMNKQEIPLFAISPRLFSLALDGWENKRCITFVTNNQLELELFRNDSLIALIKTKSGIPTIFPIDYPRIQDGEQKIELKLNSQSVYLNRNDFEIANPLVINRLPNNFYILANSEPLFNSQRFPSSELVLNWKTIYPFNEKDWMLQLNNPTATPSVVFPQQLFSVITQSGLPVYFIETELDSPEKIEIWLQSANIKSDKEVQIVLKTPIEIQSSQIHFSVKPFENETIQSESVQFNRDETTQLWNITFQQINVKNFGKSITLLADLDPSLQSMMHFKEAGNRITFAFRPDSISGFSLNESLVYPSPWVISRNQSITFSNIPDYAQILILDSTGHPVAQLQSNGFTGGVQWDGKDAFGKLISSGVYFYQIITDTNRSEIKKIAVIR